MGLSSDVIEALPFLDLMVIRHLDRESNTLSNKLCIYRKPCHSGAYIHAFSHQTTSIKRAIIRNMFLRAYRYCDNLFLEAEERKIYHDFGKLGYSQNFIDKAKSSAKKGRHREIRIRAGLEQPKTPREKARFHLGLPYHKTAQGIKHRLGLKDVDVTLSNRDTIMSRITRKTHNPTDSGVYVLTCDNNTCNEVYIGQSADIPKRIKQHVQAKNASSTTYASARHSNKEDHDLDYEHPLVVYRSNSVDHRLIVESSLISLCRTIEGNKASAAKQDMNTLAPMIVKGAPIIWRNLCRVNSSCLSPRVVPRKYRSFFSHRNGEANIDDSLPSSHEIIANNNINEEPRPPEVTISQASLSQPHYNLRSLGRLDLTVP